jgi:nitrous oxide reductase accessory protein NosL
MFVAKYPEWTASIQFKDGSRSYFDGVKDLLKFYQTPDKFGSRAGRDAMASILVKDYYSLEMVDGRSAFYVLGSDVLGPMGKELIPFARRDDAAAFLKDHRGSRILRFSELDAGVLRQLE